MKGSSTDRAWSAVWQVENKSNQRLHLSVDAATGTQVACAMAPGPAGQKWPTLRIRRLAAHTQFVVVYQFLQSGDKPLSVARNRSRLTVGTLLVDIPEGRQPLQLRGSHR